MNSASERDWVAFWYEVSRERGNNHIVSMGRGQLLDSATGQSKPLEYHDFSHMEDDGIPAVNKSLRSLGNGTENWPVAKGARVYSWFDSLRAIRYASKLSAGRTANWRAFNPQASIEGALHDYDTIAFDRVQTATLRSGCTRHKTSLNVVIALELDRLSRSLLQDPSQDTKWMFPVNIRGFLKRDIKGPNQVSYLPLLLKSRMSPDDLKNQIRSQFQKNVPWGNWCLYNIGRYIGESGVRRISERASTRSFWMGTISDIGEWKTDGGYRPLGENEIWFVAPPGSPNYPIGLTHMTFNDRLSITLKIHPALGVSSSDRRAMLSALRAHLLRI